MRLAPSYAARVPLSGVESKVQLSRRVVMGVLGRPAALRGTARRSSASASKQPAAS